MDPGLCRDVIEGEGKSEQMNRLLMTRLLAVLALVLTLAAPALAREEIRAFASDVELRTDGSVKVLETIDVQAEGSQIRRGIYRDIPVTMLGASGNKIRIDLDVEAVTRKGKPEMYRVERMGDFLRIWIGDPDVFLQYGEHRYTIAYTMERMARPTADGEGDELYWNATGNYWDFPILTSVARVRLPPRGRAGAKFYGIGSSAGNGFFTVITAGPSLRRHPALP